MPFHPLWPTNHIHHLSHTLTSHRQSQGCPFVEKGSWNSERPSAVRAGIRILKVGLSSPHHFMAFHCLLKEHSGPMPVSSERFISLLREPFSSLTGA